MKNMRRRIALLVIFCMSVVLLPVSRAWAGTESDMTAQSNINNNVISPIANYNADQVSPYNLFFANRKESADPGNGDLTVAETDLTLPGRNGFDLTLQRIYQSQEANIYRAGTAVQSQRVNYWVDGYSATRTVQKTRRVCINCVTTTETVATNTTVPGHYEEDRYIDTGCMCWKSQQVWVPEHTETTYTDVTTTTCDCHDESYTDTEQYWVDGHWDYYYDYYLVNQRTTDTWVDGRNAIGVGWQWNLPGLEILGSDITYHDGAASLLVDWNSVSHFKDYLTRDIVFDNDSGTFSNGQTTSRYRVTTKEGKKTYFGSDGRLLGIADRYGNRLAFQHTTFNGQPVISQITDTVGRVVTFAYTTTQVTVTAPGNRVWKYNLTATEAGKVQLTSMQDPAGRVTTYAYSMDSAAFSFLSKTNRDTANVYANLTRVTYPTGGATNYTYAKTVDSLGNDGSREVYKLASRSDTVSGSEVQRVTYTYSGEPGGYPNYSPATLPSTYTHAGTMTKTDGTATTVTYDSRHLPIRTEIVGTGYHTREDVTYNSNKLPTQTTVTYYNASNATRTATTSRTYDSLRNVLTTTDPLGTVTTYTYDPTFSQLTSSKVVRSDQAAIWTEYTINAANGNVDATRQVHMENGVDKSIRTTFTHDAYGNLTQSSLQMADGSYRVRNFVYDSAYGSAYLTSESETYTAADGTVGTAVSTYGYNLNTGLVTSYVDPAGGTTTVAYDALNRPTTLTFPQVDGVAARKLFAYDDANAITSVTDELGRVTTYQYDQLGRLTQTRKVLGGTTYTTRAAAFDALGHLAAETDANGNTTAYVYDAAGRTTRATYADQTFATSAFDDAANAATVTDPNANATVTFFDALGRTIQVNTKPDRNGTMVYQAKTTYDNVGNVTSAQDARGNITYYAYDDLNRLTRQTDALGNIASFTYNNAGQKLSETGPDGRTMTYAYDPAGRLLTVTDPLAGVTRYTYDAKGRQLSHADPRGSKTTYAYDLRDRLIQQTDALGGTTTNTFDLVGNRTSAADARGNKTTYAYDEWNRLTSSTSPLGGVTSYTYDRNGNQTKVTDPLGNQTTFTYDQRNRLTTEVNALGVTVSAYTYDGAGNRTSSTDARGGVTHFTYDGLNRLTQTTDPLSITTRSEYDANGNLTRAVDGRGNATTYEYDALNRLVSATDSIGVTWRYTLDAYGNVTKVTDPLAHVMREDTFDKLNRVVSRKDALGNVTTNTYDAAGNLTGVQSGGLSRTMTYDVLNRLTKLTATGGLSIDFTYDATGNRTQMVDATGTTTYTYNAANRMTEQAVPGGKSIRYAYNAASQLTKVTDYGNNATTYTRDAVGRVTGAQFADGSAATFGYDAAGNRTSLTLPGLATSYTYDADNRVTGLTNSNGAGQTLGSYSYAYDQAHNLVSQTDAKGQTQYTYDADDRLTKAVQPSGATTTYAYDAAGNRASMADATGTTTYTYDAANRLLKEDSAAGTKTYAWDANGNQLSDGSAQYEYDSLNRLTAVTVQGQRVTYSYDGDGMMVARTAGGSTTRFYLDGQRVINEGDGAGAVTAAMFRGAGLSLGRQVGTAPTAYYLYNAHGDVVGVANGAGDQLASYEYDAFGVLTASTGSFDNPYRYAGEYFDYTTGQYYLRARFYSPRTGRFLSQDTVLGEYNDPLSLNLYAYVKGNPLTFVDPTGHVGKMLVENSSGGSNQVYVATWLIRLEWQAVQDNLQRHEMYIPYSAYDVADQMGIDHDTVENVSSYMWGEEETGFSKLRYEQLVGQREAVSEGWAPETYCLSMGCRYALTSGQGTMLDVSAGAEIARVITEGGGQATRGIERQLYGEYGSPGNPEYFKDGLPAGKVAQTSKAPTVPDEAANRARFEQYREELANQEHLDAVQAQTEEPGYVMAGGPKATEFRDRVRIAEQYGGNPEDWVKMRSSSNSTQDGVPFETHWVQNLKTGQRVEFKTKYNGGQNGIWYHY